MVIVELETVVNAICWKAPTPFLAPKPVPLPPTTPKEAPIKKIDPWSEPEPNVTVPAVAAALPVNVYPEVAPRAESTATVRTLELVAKPAMKVSVSAPAADPKK